MDYHEDDKERGRLSSENKAKWGRSIVNPRTLKLVLSMGPWIVKILRLIVELVKLFKG